MIGTIMARINDILLFITRPIQRFFGLALKKLYTLLLVLTNLKEEDVLHTPSLLATVFYLIIIFAIGVPVWFWTCSLPRYPLPDVNLLIDQNNELKLKLDISVVLLDKPGEEHTESLRKFLPSSEISVNKLHYHFNWRVRRPLAEELKVILKQNSGVSNELFLQDIESKLLAIHNTNNRFRLWVYVMKEQQYDSWCQKAHSFTLGFERFVFVCPSTVVNDKERPQALSRLIMDSVRETHLNSIDTKRINHLLSSELDLVVNMILENDSEISSLDELNKKADLVHSVAMKNVRQRYPELTELVNIKLKSQIIFNSFDKKIFEQALIRQANKPHGSQYPFRQSINRTTDKASITSGHADPADSTRLFDIKKSRQFINSVRSRISKHHEKHIYYLLLFSPSATQPPLLFHHQTVRSADPIRVEQSLLVGSDSNSMLIWNSNKDLVLGLRALYRHLLGFSWTDIHSQCMKKDIFFTRWEIDSLLAGLTVAKLSKTSKSLESIKELVAKVSNIVIEKEVAYKMEEAFQLSLQSLASLEQNDILNAFRLSSKAYDLSESAFFDPSLLELLYFPHDQKYAIYFPLFMPLLFPIAVSIWRVITAYIVYRRKLKNTIKEKQS